MFIGSDSSQSDVWVGNGNGTAGENGIIGIFSSTDSDGSNSFLETIGNPSGTEGTEGNGTIAEDTIADNVYDLEYIFNKYASSSNLTESDWSDTSGVNNDKTHIRLKVRTKPRVFGMTLAETTTTS